MEPTLPAKAMHLLTSMPVSATLVVIMPNLHASTKAVSPSIFSLREASSLFLALYGSAGLLPVSVLENVLPDIVDRVELDEKRRRVEDLLAVDVLKCAWIGLTDFDVSESGLVQCSGFAASRL